MLYKVNSLRSINILTVSASQDQTCNSVLAILLLFFRLKMKLTVHQKKKILMWIRGKVVFLNFYLNSLRIIPSLILGSSLLQYVSIFILIISDYKELFT